MITFLNKNHFRNGKVRKKNSKWFHKPHQKCGRGRGTLLSKFLELPFALTVNINGGIIKRENITDTYTAISFRFFPVMLRLMA